MHSFGDQSSKLAVGQVFFKREFFLNKMLDLEASKHVGKSRIMKPRKAKRSY